MLCYLSKIKSSQSNVGSALTHSVAAKRERHSFTKQELSQLMYLDSTQPRTLRL